MMRSGMGRCMGGRFFEWFMRERRRRDENVLKTRRQFNIWIIHQLNSPI
jgi:hypothetical protein